MPHRPRRPRASTSATPAKILGYCLHQLGSREEAEDAVQTTFMNAFRALGRGVVPEAESAWLFKIAENVCLSRRRSSWRRGRIESPSDFDVIEEVVPGPSRQRDELIGIEDALASMPEQQRRAILLREWQGLSYREISEELELSQSAVETLIFRARRSLAQGLEQPELLKKPKRKGFRRALHVIDLGTLAAAAKTLLAGSAAVKATAAAVAVTAAVTAASVTPKLEGHSPKPAQAPALSAPSAAAPRPPGRAHGVDGRRGAPRRAARRSPTRSSRPREPALRPQRPAAPSGAPSPRPLRSRPLRSHRSHRRKLPQRRRPPSPPHRRPRPSRRPGAGRRAADALRRLLSRATSSRRPSSPTIVDHDDAAGEPDHAPLLRAAPEIPVAPAVAVAPHDGS